jgi:hypothetical protein
VTWHVGGEDGYYEVPFIGECPTCGTLLVDDDDECSTCAEDEYLRGLRDEGTW